jgi:hypothetical protein
MISGHSNVVKGFQSLTVSEELLQKIVEAVLAGEKEARSSGVIQSFEVFFRGFRQNIVLGRIYLIPPSVCNDKDENTFPTALLYGSIVREFGGEELGDLIEKRIGETEFDEYSQADFDTVKEKLFGTGDGKFESLVLFAPSWMNSREYVVFKFTKDVEQLKNNLRHQVFSAYYDPRLSSAFDAMLTNVNTTKVDVTDITPKIPFPFLAENILKEFPNLQKQASGHRRKIFLTHHTADAVTKEILDPQELDVFESLDQALTEATMPGVETVEEASAPDSGGYNAPDSSNIVPRVAASDAKQAASGDGWTVKIKEKGGRERTQNAKGDNYSQVEKKVKLRDGETIISMSLASANKKASDEAPLAAHETPFTNVGPGTEAHEKQKDIVPAMKENVELKAGEPPIGIELDKTGLPVNKGDKSKAAKRVTNEHPEMKPGLAEDFSASISKKYSGGFCDESTPKDVVAYIKENVSGDKQSASAVADHARTIEAGGHGDYPLEKSAAIDGKKWGTASVPMDLKRKAKINPADYVAQHIAREIDEPYEAMSPRAKKARMDNESKLMKNRRKQADVPMDIDSIWAELTEEMGPAPVVDVPDNGGKYQDSKSDSDSGSEPKDERSSDSRPRKSDMGKAPESTEPKEEKSGPPKNAPPKKEKEETSEAPKSEEDHEDEKPWRVSSGLEDFVHEAAAGMEQDHEASVEPKNEGENRHPDYPSSKTLREGLNRVDPATKYPSSKTLKDGLKRVGKDKQADTNDNPYNMRDGVGAPTDKKNAEKPDTAGPDIKNTASVNSEKAFNKNFLYCKTHDISYRKNNQADGSSKCPLCADTPASKKADAVQPDIAEARSLVVSPHTVDADIQQETESVEEASKTALYDSSPATQEPDASAMRPHLPEPTFCEACGADDDDLETVEPFGERVTLCPKCRQQFGKFGSNVSDDISEARAELDHGAKSDLADSSEATKTVNPEHFAGKIADHMVDTGHGMSIHEDPREDNQNPSPSIGDLGGGIMEEGGSGVVGELAEAAPVLLASAKEGAAGDEAPEEVSFDSGCCGDLADLVVDGNIDDDSK